jgi:hypothetical protein
MMELDFRPIAIKQKRKSYELQDLKCWFYESKSDLQLLQVPSRLQ